MSDTTEAPERRQSEEEIRDERHELMTNDFIAQLTTLSDGESMERFQGYLSAAIAMLQTELQASRETSGGG